MSAADVGAFIFGVALVPNGSCIHVKSATVVACALQVAVVILNECAVVGNPLDRAVVVLIAVLAAAGNFAGACEMAVAAGLEIVTAR